MKLFTKLLITALVIGLLLPFTILKDDSGNTLMSFSDFGLPDLPDLPDLSSVIKRESSFDPIVGEDTFYKWLDSEGNLQFTTEPPADGIEYTTKSFDPNTNVIPAVEVLPKKAKQDSDAASKKKPEKMADPTSAYSTEGIKKLFEDTQNIEKLLNDRLKQQQTVIGQ